MKRISKSAQADIDKTLDACREAAEELEAAIDAHNAALASIRDRLEAAVSTYNERIADLRSVYEDIASEARSYFEDRSERWQESDAGQTYSEWVDQLENIEMEDVDIEMPEELELPDSIPDFSELSWLPPEEPGGV